MAATPQSVLARLPLLAGMVALLAGGVFLLERAEAQARDTIRKHHLADIERALFFARDTAGTFPPYDAPTWCGRLNDPVNTKVRAEVEAALRAQNEKYGNLEKPFPTDPLFTSAFASGETGPDYFYWKRSPALFELYAILEADPNATRTTGDCAAARDGVYDYGLSSGLREDLPNFTP